MNINDLFEEIQKKFTSDDLKGELILHGNCIIWSYSIENDSEEFDSLNFENNEDEENSETLEFEPISSEELLQDAYNEVFEKIEILLDEFSQTDSWEFSDADIIENTISFKIF